MVANVAAQASKEAAAAAAVAAAATSPITSIAGQVRTDSCTLFPTISLLSLKIACLNQFSCFKKEGLKI